MSVFFGLGALKAGPAAAKTDKAKQPAADKPRMRPYAYYMPVSSIHTDPARFQNRDTEYSEATVSRLLAKFDVNQLDPIVIWRDPKARKVFVLSGHSRLEAHRRAGLKEIPVRFYEGSEADAINFARVQANRLATSETLREDIKAFKLMRDGNAGRGIKPQDDKALREQWGQQFGKLSAYSYLNPKGLALDTLTSDARESFPRIGTKAAWIGQIRRRFSALTNLHEDELFRFLFMNETGAKAERADVEEMVERRVNNPEFDAQKPLGIEDCKTCFQPKRRDTDNLQKELCALQDIQKMMNRKEFRALVESLTPETKAEIAAYSLRIASDVAKLEKGIETVVKSQNSLFGVRVR